MKKMENKNENQTSRIKELIMSSKKFRGINEQLVDSLIVDFTKKYKPKEIEKEVRNKLHQIWGTYFKSIPDYNKLLQKLTIGQITFAEICMIHISTSERNKFVSDFYSQIFEKIGRVKNVLDLGCGFNPLNISHMQIAEGGKYIGVDIDKNELEFLEKALAMSSVKFEGVFKSALEIEMQNYDVIFILKLLQNLEQQKKNSGVELILKSLDHAKYMVVSFPTKSVSGKSKGMENSYSVWFENIVSQNNIKIEKLLFVNEIVYICQK
jgi:16S rRNA (guanine(1405)-N(7))-methyltransferase